VASVAPRSTEKHYKLTPTGTKTDTGTSPRSASGPIVITCQTASTITATVLADIRRLHTAIAQGIEAEQELAWASLEQITAALHSGLTDVIIAVANGVSLDQAEVLR
jgi:hypothetical protein